VGRYSFRSSLASPSRSYAALTPAAGGLAFVSSYHPELVAEFKRAIPHEARTWDGAHKRWLIDTRYGDVCAQLAERFLGVKIVVPQLHTVAKTETRLVRLEYLGGCKARDGSEASAYGWVFGSWSTIFPETVLRAWFEVEPQKPGEKPTMYAVLLVKQTAPIDEIRRNYRRLARQYHPDVNHEADAVEQFKVIQTAYEVLADEQKRRKYDAGLRFEKAMAQKPDFNYRNVVQAPLGSTYRPPLRCGWVLAEGQEILGRFVVSKVLQWEDIVGGDGRTMVSSWPMGNKAPEIGWD
jgi:DnaJ-domain-containing protein 1